MEFFKYLVDLVESLIWPVLILFFFLYYKKELNNIFSHLPDLIKKSKKVSFGGLSIEVENIAKEVGNLKLANMITSLSEDEIKLILKIGESNQVLFIKNNDTVIRLPKEISTYYKLSIKGLINATYGYKGENLELHKFVQQYEKLNLTKLKYPVIIEKVRGLNPNRLSLGLNKSNVDNDIWE